MPSKRTEPRSIASQLVLLFTPAAALLLFCGLAVFYWIVVRHAFEEDNRALSDKLIALRADFTKTGGTEVLAEQLKALRAGEHADYWIRLIDSNGRTVAETPAMTELLPPSAFPKTQTSSFVRNPKDYRTAGKLFSLVAILQEAGGQPLTIQLAQDRSADEQFTKEFAALLVIVMALGILASAAIAISVARRGLRPLTEMTHSLKRIGPMHLNERLAPARWPPELQPLAVAFDEMLNRLEDSFRRLSQFSADLAHELRTPIANILGESQVALTRVRTQDEYREVIESSVAECERLSGIIDNLLFLARAEAADGHIQPTLFDGKAAVAKIASFYETVADEQQITISCTGEGNICADRMLFDRALSNLLENALRYTPKGGTILISIAAGAVQSEISVKDTGCGIAPEHVAHVFDRFYRADSSRSSEGAGLGLALVKSITDLHGGSATINSEVNRGTIVTITFPGKPGLESGIGPYRKNTSVG
jgi:two-component system, OmpR family, heavy metal sensor histidine kinase CusS